MESRGKGGEGESDTYSKIRDAKRCSSLVPRSVTTIDPRPDRHVTTATMQ